MAALPFETVVEGAVYLIKGKISNMYVLVARAGDEFSGEGEGGLTLIDGGCPIDSTSLSVGIEALPLVPKRSLADVRRIILTHSDGDHTGCISVVLAASHPSRKPLVTTSKIEADAIAVGGTSRQGSWWIRPLLWLSALYLGTSPPTPVDEIVKDGDILHVLGGLHVVSTIGHTPDHISLHVPALGVLFTGDSATTNPDGSLSHSSFSNWDNGKFIESAKKMAALNSTILCPGHGPVSKDAVAAFKNFFQ